MTGNKYSNSIFKNEVGTVKTIVRERKEEFSKLSLEKQCYVLQQILIHMCEGAIVDLVDIGGKAKCGKLSMNHIVSSANELKLIMQSATGINRVELNLLEI